MNKKVTAITLIMENCEHFTIPIINVTGLSINKITDSYFSIAYNHIVYQRKCKSLYLTLDVTASLLQGTLEERQLYDRIRSNDITHIELVFDDKTTDYITVKWSADNPYTNTFQTTAIRGDGSIDIVVKKRKT